MSFSPKLVCCIIDEDVHCTCWTLGLVDFVLFSRILTKYKKITNVSQKVQKGQEASIISFCFKKKSWEKALNTMEKIHSNIIETKNEIQNKNVV